MAGTGLESTAVDWEALLRLLLALDPIAVNSGSLSALAATHRASRTGSSRRIGCARVAAGGECGMRSQLSDQTAGGRRQEFRLASERASDLHARERPTNAQAIPERAEERRNKQLRD